MKGFSILKKAIISALVAVSFLLVGVGIVACDKGSNEGKVPELIGWDGVQEAITVEQYALVVPENVHVTDAEGTMYDVVVKVRDSNGNLISTDEGNKFNAYDANGYTITYSIDTWEFSVSKTVTIHVNKADDNLDFDIECDTLVSVGDTVNVEISSKATNPVCSLAVVHKESGVACETDEMTFVPTQIGIHTVKVTVEADEGMATKTMEMYVRKPLQEGEVEVFDEDWLTVREFNPRKVGMEATWSTATTAETQIKDADGNDGTFAVLEPEAEYTHIYFNIREDRAYYRDLVMQGYTHVRFRIYVDSPEGKGKLFNWEHNATNTWRTSLGSAKAGDWTEFYIPLATGIAGTSDKRPGFVESYEYYFSTWILLLDNSASAWNPNGKDESDYKIYFDDIMAVRRTHKITYNTTVASGYNLSSSELLKPAWRTDIEDYTYSVYKYASYGYNAEPIAKKENQTLTTGDVDLKALDGSSAYGSYKIEYFLEGSDPTIPYQTVWFDVMDNTQKVYANMDLRNFSVSSRGMIWCNPDSSASFTANADGTMTYTTDGLWGAGLQIAPTFDKSYYEALKKEGYKTLSFDLKMDVTYKTDADANAKSLPYEVYTLATGGKNGTVYQSGDTHTLTISLDAIITYYNKLRGTGNAKDNWFAEYVLFHVEYGKNEGENDTNPNDDTAAYQHSKLTFTISDFKLVK